MFTLFYLIGCLSFDGGHRETLIELRFSPYLKDTDIEKVQREFCGLANENCLVVDRNYVIEMRLRLKAEQKERLEAKYLVDTKETVVEFGELYKWTSVVKKQKQTKKRVAIKKSASDEGFIYAYYYNYYYQHFLDQLIKV